MRIVEHPGRIDVTSVPWLAWLFIPVALFGGLVLMFSVIAPLLALISVAGVAWFARCRRWRFEGALGEVRFAKALLPIGFRPEPTLVQRPGESHEPLLVGGARLALNRAHVFGTGERVEFVRFADIERAVVAGTEGHRSHMYALTLELKDGRFIEFGIGRQSWGQAAMQRAADSINRLLASSPTIPSSTDAESFAGSPVAVPTLVAHEQ